MICRNAQWNSITALIFLLQLSIMLTLLQQLHVNVLWTISYKMFFILINKLAYIVKYIAFIFSTKTWKSMLNCWKTGWHRYMESWTLHFQHSLWTCTILPALVACLHCSVLQYKTVIFELRYLCCIKSQFHRWTTIAMDQSNIGIAMLQQSVNWKCVGCKTIFYTDHWSQSVFVHFLDLQACQQSN